MVLVTAPDFQQAALWCRDQQIRTRNARFIFRIGDLQYVRGYRLAEVHWISDGPYDQRVRDELYALRAAGIIKIIQEHT